MVRTRVLGALMAAVAVGARLRPPQLSGSRTAGAQAAPALRPAVLDSTAVTIVGLAVLLAIVVSASRGFRRRPTGRTRARPDAGSSAGPSTDAMASAASSALVATDDAVRTSEQELGFATARFGERATAPFAAAVHAARAELAAAFALRQLLDDAAPGEAETRIHLADIAAHCATANRLLDEQADAFDRLQNLQVRAPELMAEIDAHVTQQMARMDRARQVLADVAARYTPEAIDVVVSNPDEALDRLEFAADCLASARLGLAAGRAAAAVRLLQAAESSADQATDLLSGVERRQAQLTQAASALPGALRELDAEIAEAAQMPTDDRRRQDTALLSSARDVAAAVRARQQAGPFDTVAALREIQHTDAALDQALAAGRDAHANRQRAAPVLDEAMLVARSSVAAAEEFVETRRGGIGVIARTRLAESHRHFGRAIACLKDDPERALAEALTADGLAQHARTLAERDVCEIGDVRMKPSRGDAAAGRSASARLGTAILGGIVISADATSFGPGSFGGVGTRRRHASAPLPVAATLDRPLS